MLWLCIVQPGDLLNIDNLARPHPFLIQQKDRDRSSFKLLCDGSLCDCGETVVEAFDFLFMFFWVFGLEYPPAQQQFFSFFQYKVYKLKYGRVTPSVNELGQMFELNDKWLAWMGEERGTITYHHTLSTLLTVLSEFTSALLFCTSNEYSHQWPLL